MTHEVNFGPLVKFNLAEVHDWYEERDVIGCFTVAGIPGRGGRH